MQVLILDDDEARARRIARVLAAEGFAVELADRQQALAEPGALVVVGGSQAHELCRALRLSDNDCRVVALLPSSAPEAVLAAIDAGADSHLTPPHSNARIVACVRRVSEPGANLAIAQEVTLNLPRERLVGLLVNALEDGADKIAGSPACGDPVHQQQFMGVVAHELRNPLQSLLLRAQLATQGDSRAVTALPQMVEAKVTAVVQFIAEVLDVTELDTGKVELRRQRVRLGDIVREGMERARDDAHEVVLHGATDLELEIDADPDAVRRIVENYLRNAFKYSPAGSAVDMTLERRGDMARVSVTDRGSPIPAEHAEEAFATLYRRSGILTGLGLYTSFRLAELHGGRVGVDGATFWVELPLNPPLDG